MSENKKGVLESLGDYMNQIFDRDKDGIVSIKELFSVFPNMAVTIAIIFVDVLVMVAEYRVWDFGLYVTGDPIKAIGFVLVSAVPFLLGQVFWLYPRATFLQKCIAISFVAMSLYTSANFGLADLTAEYNANDIFTFLVQLTAGYIVGTLIYIVVDPSIKASRMKKKAQDAAEFERELQGIANSILTSLQETLTAKKSLAETFGEDEVEKALAQLRGNKKKNSQQSSQQHSQQPQLQPARQFNTDTANPTNGANSQQPPQNSQQR